MEKLIDIKGYWVTDGIRDYSDNDMWEGQFILNEDGWIEGIVTDHCSSYCGDMFIYGAFFPDFVIKLVKLTPSEISDPFVFTAKKEGTEYNGKFDIIGYFGTTPFGECKIITELNEKQDIQELQARITKFKANTTDDEVVTSSYQNTFKIRSQFLEVIKRNCLDIPFTDEELEAMKEITDPVKDTIFEQTVNHFDKELKRILTPTMSDDDLPF